MSVTLSAQHSPPVPQPATVQGWGAGAGARVLLARPGSVEAAAQALRTTRTRGAIARGMGRSYGDAAQLSGGLVLDTTALTRVQLDPDTGTVTAEAGVTIAELLRALVPAGWVLPVVPGTQHVTVGGAIASDIHGKSHGVDGTFGSHVQALGLLTATGELEELAPQSELFQATLGGMGLTGMIVWARIALRPVSSSLLSVDTDRVRTLDDALAALAAPGGRYRVGWLDLLGSRHGRGVVTRAEHAAGGPSDGATVPARATVPRRWPAGALRTSTVRAFNELRYRASPRRARGRSEQLGPHMFPLDALDAWPRLYGPRGFVQYQLVVPPARVDVLEQTIERLRRARVPCYLAVLKDFGPANAAPLSFPIEGWTLALDLPRGAPNLGSALDALDGLVAGAGGRVYLTKDSRMRPEALAAMYPRLEQWRAVRDRADPDGLWRSDLALRTGLVSR
ncbi:MAG TPA: FAD-binding oxidoreductase [Solirubrobacteraceae bacterium]|nr:FAD-binding oxidoreductase [Solirubrobacteraceae bacterium]